ncbi:MAG: outer membrane lipoprotein chaperone LolA [Acidithiobacillus sp.]
MIERLRTRPTRGWGWLLFALLLTGAGWAQAAPAPGSQILQHFFQQVQTVQAQFTQVVTNRNGQIIKRAAGTVWIQRPGKFRWVYDGSNGQTIVSNGTRVWLYDPALQQVTIQPLDKTLGSTPAALIAGKDILASRFVIRDLGSKDGIRWVELQPKNGQDQGFTAVRLGFDARGALQEMRMEDAFQQETVLTFHDIRLNQPIAAREFQFTPPAGVDVLKQP